jgi:hypothetical protein
MSNYGRFFVVLTVLAGSFCGALYAHEPSDVKINFDNTAKTLKVYVHHPSSALDKHYIEKVQIIFKGKIIVEQSLAKQDDEKGVKLIYRLPEAVYGAAVSIQAYSTIEGAKRFDFILNKEENQVSSPADVVK